MLTDIFATRYEDVQFRDTFEERDRRLIVQAYRIVIEQLFPPYVDGKENKWAQAKLKAVHDKLSNELGLHELGPRAYSYQREYAGKSYTQSGTWSWDHICKEYVSKQFLDTWDSDVFIKNRLSFIEIAFRERWNDVVAANAKLPLDIAEAEARMAIKAPGIRLPGSLADGVRARNKTLNDNYKTAADELNERFRQAKYKLNYHNGYIQIVGDEKVEVEIEAPFWALVADRKWKNVDTDMAEAIDRRDTGGRDPAWYAARALESTIKIISDDMGWTHGGEKGAHGYIDNLGSKKNGLFISDWERDSLKQFFSAVRAPFAHGAGSDPMPQLTSQQTSWAIEFCMSWIRSLIERVDS